MKMISIVIATFNAKQTLARAMESIIHQNMNDWELLIIDGGSSDGTMDVVRKYSECNSRIRYISESDDGIYDAWNKGIKFAEGEWILFIGADDLLASNDVLKDAAKQINNLMQKDNANPVIIYGKQINLGRDGRPVCTVGRRWESPWSLKGHYLVGSLPIPIMATFFNRKALNEYGGFNTQYKIVADAEYVLRVARTSPPVFMEGVVVTKMASGGVSTGVQTTIQVRKESVKVRRAHGLSLMNAGLILNYIKAIVRRFIRFAFGAKMLSTAEISYDKYKRWRQAKAS